MSRSPAPALADLLLDVADLVQGVTQGGRSLAALLPAVPAARRPAVQALSFHALRWWGAATELRRQLVPRAPAPPVAALLGTALALLWPPGAPPYAQHTLVDQAVRATRRRAPASAGFVNAVLRRFVRESEACVARVLGTALGSTNHPAWWVQRLRADWPAAWPALIDAANRHPPMTLRVNRRRCSGADYLAPLALAGRGARLLAGAAWGGQAVMLDEPCPVHELPGFDAGDVSVQDGSAQRAAPLLLGVGDDALRAGARVLDACAAPGGKTAHLLELADLDLLALDADAARLQRVHQNLERLGLHAELRAADAARPADWWDGRLFDAILLDAPCTASGIERRHPDVRWLRRPEDVAALASTQAALLEALWPLLAPGGRLLYATCSVFRAEGEQVIDAFLQRRATERPALDTAAPGHLLPLPDNADDPAGGTPLAHDGFYYALIHKPAC